MYTTIKSEDVKKYSNLKLCYIDGINRTYWDLTPEAKAYRETDEWKEQDRLRDEKLRREGCMSSDDPEFGWYANAILRRGGESEDYPNPEYVPGKQEYYAYFTPISLDKQWGDDWNDSPYEYNAEIPYDDYREGDERVEVEIVRVPFYIPYDGGWHIRFPKDWGGCNSPFSVEDINGGAVAWIFDKERKIVVPAGCTPEEFVEKIEKINEGREYIDHEDDED